MNPTDERDFGAFAGTAVRTLLPVAHALTGSQAIAERLLTTTLARVARRWHRFRTEPTEYATKILYREYAGRRRAAAPVALQAVDERGLDGLRLRHIALRQLARRPRAVLVLRYLQDRTDAEAAQVVGGSPEAVAGEIAEALAQLRALRAGVAGASADTADIDIEAEVRRTLRELAGAAEPAGLVPAVLAAARRQRATRLATTVAAVMALAALAGGVAVAVLRPDPPPPQDPAGLTVVTSYHDGGAWYVLDPDTGEYRYSASEPVAVAPDLRSAVAAQSGPAAFQLSATTDRGSAATVDVPGPPVASPPAWSPDSVHVASVVGSYEEQPAARFVALVEVAAQTGEALALALPAGRTASTTAPLFWLDAAHFAVPTGELGAWLPDRSDLLESLLLDAVSVFDLTGALVAELPVDTSQVAASDEPHAGLAWRPAGAMPGGRFLLAREPEPGTVELAAVDLETDPGPYPAVTIALPEAPVATRWTAAQVSLSGTTALVSASLTPDRLHPSYDRGRQPDARFAAYLVNLDTGQVTPVSLAELPIAAAATTAAIGDASGLSPAAAHRAFVP